MKNIIIFALVFLTFMFLSCCSSKSQEIRKPAVAGTFYPSEKSSLEEMVSTFLKNVPQHKFPQQSRLIGLIVPHAGYVYSGQVAAYSYKLLGDYLRRGSGSDKPASEPARCLTLIIIGPSHYVSFDGISIYPEGAWETPLGKVEIDNKVALSLMEKSRRIHPYPLAHLREHSLEVQIPFLQMVLKDFKIVPLIIGNPSIENCQALADAIFSTGLSLRLGKDVLIIASSDMSHYHSYAKACLMDGLCLKDIESLDTEKLLQDMGKGLCELCGAGAVFTLINVAKRLNAKAEVLKYANSGDVTGEKDRVVGYGAVAFYIQNTDALPAGQPYLSSEGMQEGKSVSEQVQEKSNVKGVQMLNEKQKKRLLEIARKTLEEYIRNGTVPEFKETDPVLAEKGAAFVTLTKSGNLRGCIGYIQPVLPLYETVVKMAIESSTGDPRFPKVRPEELKDIRIEISVLSPIELINDVNKIEVGKHGLIIRKGFYQGLLLPQVATSHHWDKWEFLDQTCIKAGLPPGSWKDKDTEIYVFSAQVFGEE